jgi:tetratricopeptide (TPR) repeat protein
MKLNDNVFVGEVKQLPKRLNKRKNLLLLGIGAVIVICGLILVIANLSDRSATKKIDKSVSETAQDAYSSANKGDYVGAQQALDAKLANSSSNADKAQIYITQYTLALDAKKYDEAKDYADKAESVQPTDATAVLLGDIALQNKDTAEARKYYELAISRLNKDNRSYPSRLKTYQVKLKAVQ